ncbi:hypothetical protein A8B82_22900 [Sulfitobacter sp. EhC04]|nr:hypothetical protein A8B82_22900 [Sulfitobacter sp. EhC04]
MDKNRMELNGFKWPDGDVHCRKVVFSSVIDMEPALRLTDGRAVAVQAGGNCGVWPAWLAERFERVFTFEPDQTNFDCLVQNVPENVTAYRAALGSKRGRVGMCLDTRNIGAHFIDGKGSIPVKTIDSLKLKACDYLCLDVEGYEMPALIGSIQTINVHRPVIQIEDKGLSERYGYQRGEAIDWLKMLGYRVRHRVARDVILSCAPA